MARLCVYSLAAFKFARFTVLTMANPEKSSRLIKWATILGTGVILVAILLAVLCGPDQIQPVPANHSALAPLLKEPDAKRIKEWSAATNKQDTTATLHEIVERNYPFPPLSRWPKESQPLARQYQQEATQWLGEILTLPQRTRALPMDEAEGQLNQLTTRLIETGAKPPYRALLAQLTQSERAAMAKQRDEFWRGPHGDPHRARLLDRGGQIEC